jgi:hypothetical protein
MLTNVPRADLRLTEEGRTYAIGLPRDGYLQDFRLHIYSESDPVPPGESVSFPALLSVPWASLPGIVSCWVETKEYLALGTESPDEISQFFRQYKIVSTAKGSKKIPRFMYLGKTLGPVPVPDSRISPAEFFGKLLEYHIEAQRLGWYNDRSTTVKVTSQLEALRVIEEGADVDSILQTIESGFKTQRIEGEAYVLLRYNLEHWAYLKSLVRVSGNAPGAGLYGAGEDPAS